MGHLDVWAYVILSQGAASITPPMAGALLTAIDLWLTSFYPSSRGSGNRSRQGPEVSLSPSTSHSPKTDTHTHTCPVPPGLTLICFWRKKLCSWHRKNTTRNCSDFSQDRSLTAQWQNRTGKS